MSNSSVNRIEYSPDVANGLAKGALKVDQSLVEVGPERPITGDERIARSTLHNEIATAALVIHDRLVAAGEKIPRVAEVRAHLLRVIELSKDPVEEE